MENIPNSENTTSKTIFGIKDLESKTFDDIIAALESDEASATKKVHAKMMREGELTPILLKTIAKDFRIDLSLKQAPDVLEKIKKNSQ